ncbi:MAG TPA: hypothetical protein VMW62_11015 [Chloroflexota bacterium]|nr:hypothetical protein [Chloroflexota bacterium]
METVEPDPRNIRRGAIDPADVATLRLALQAALARGEEFESPISVYPVGAGRFRIKHGHRRFAAAKLEGVRRLHFHIVSPPSERDRILDQLDDNLNARSISHVDIACALDALRHLGSVEDGAQKELSLRQLVVLLRERGVPGAEKEEAGRTWVRQHLDLLKLHDEVRELVHGGKVGYSIAIKLKDLPLKDQPLLARRIVTEGLSWRDVDVLLGRESHANGQFSEDDGFDAGAALMAAGANSPVEAQLLALVGQIEASAEAANNGRRPRRSADPSRRNSAVELEWEPYTASALPEPVDANARHDLERLNSSDWAMRASAGALTLARDLIAWAHREPDDARRLADACMSELTDCPQEYRRLLYSMRMMLDGTEPGPPPPSVGLMLRLYCQELSRRLPAA